MKTDDAIPVPVLIPTKSTVLLVFMPPNWQQRAALNSLVNALPGVLNGSLRILQLDESIHPEVVQSFTVGRLPAFILVRQGIEIWRHEGPPNEAILSTLSQRLLTS